MSIGRVPGATGIQPSIVTAKGDLIVATASGSVTNQAVGSNNQVLTADSAQADGVKWANGSAATLTTTGDILYASAANTPARLGIGSTDQVLKVSGGIPAWGAAPSPSFAGCLLWKNADQTVNASTWTAITFEVEKLDSDGYHSTTTNTSRITIPSGKAGKYMVVAQGTQEYGNANAVSFALYKNGANIDLGPYTSAGAYDQTAIASTFIVDLAVGDYIEMFWYQNFNGTGRRVWGDNDGSTKFGAYLIGA